MKRFFILLVIFSCCIVTTYAADSIQNVSSIQTLGDHTGTLNTRMGGKESSIATFTLNYLDGVLDIEPFKVGKMPGSISVLASDLVEGTEQRVNKCVTLTMDKFETVYDAYITVNIIEQKLNIIINVINPIYEGASFVAHVEFVEK